MIPFGTDAVTLYNRRERRDANNRTVVTWHRSELAGCFWTRRSERILNGTEWVAAEVIVCRIPEDPNYLDPQAWDTLTDVSGRFTLAPGDILVRGITTDQIGESLRASDLVEKHRRGGVMTVTAAQNNVRPGLPLGHYLARGV